jgi:excisionase family DNA binding protein
MKVKKHLKTTEAAEYLGVARSSVTNWIRSGALKAASTPGGHYLIQLEQLRDFAADRGIELAERNDVNGVYRILLIDDDSDFRSFVIEALDVYSGYELREAEDGMQGALLVGTWKPDLVIVDLRMPNMNGVEFCRLLKGDDTMEDVKVVVASAYLSPEVRDEVAGLGVNGILEKPVRLEALVAMVGRLTGLELNV